MDEELRSYLEAMEGRLIGRFSDSQEAMEGRNTASREAMEGRLIGRFSDSQEAMEGRITASQEAMESRLIGRINASQEAMEGRLMSRINDSQEHILERLSAADRRQANLELAVAGLIELARSTNTQLATIAGSLTDFAIRLARLENKT